MNSPSNVDKRDSTISRSRRSATSNDGSSRQKRPPRRNEYRLNSSGLSAYSADTDSTSDAFAVPNDVLTSQDEERRIQLLRRLNQIAQKKTMLARKKAGSPSIDGPPSSARAANSSSSRDHIRSSRFSRSKSTAAKMSEKCSSSPTMAEPMTVENVEPSPAPPVVPPKPSANKLDLMMRDRNKRGSGNPSGPLPRPPTIPLCGTQGSTAKNAQVSYCLRMVKEMIRLKDAYAFARPIDRIWSRDQLPGYFEMIEKPMDLGTVRARLEAGWYLDPAKDMEDGTYTAALFLKEKFAADMRLIFHNARTYNRKGDPFYESATRLLEKFDTKFAAMSTKLAETGNKSKSKSKKRKKSTFSTTDRRRSGESRSKKQATNKNKVPNAATGSSASASVNTESLVSNVPPPTTTARKSVPKKKASKTKANDNPNKERVGRRAIEDMTTLELTTRIKLLEVRLNNPKSNGSALYNALAKALYDVDVTFEEKVYLGDKIGDLPGDKLSKLVSLASKDSNQSVEVNTNDEVELDFDGLGTRTLRDMQAIVNQALNARKGFVNTMRNGDVARIPRAELQGEMDLLKAALSKKANGKKSTTDERDAPPPSGDGKGSKGLYESDSDSDSDSDGSSSDDSSDDDSSDDDSSADDESPESKLKRRERNLAHQQAMQAAGTPLQSPGA